MNERDEAAPDGVDEEETREVAVPPLERWIDLVRGLVESEAT